MPSGFIPKEKLSAYERWELAAFDEEAAEAANAHPADDVLALPTAADIERIHNEAHAAGYAAGQDLGHAAGYEAGFEGGHAEGREAGYTVGYATGRIEVGGEARRIAELGANLRQRLQDLDQEIAEELLTVAVEIASQILRQSLRVQPALLLPVVREAIAALPLHHGHPALYLNPSDAALVRTHLGEQLAHNGWRIIEDSETAAGGCRIVSGASEVDATLATRWRRVLEAIGTTGDWLEEKS
ncbi:MAG: flagellar assembly protein FliH [Rhodocyclaceae bacterium]|nr:flagellar assembly protein FliH [Rhodocyclaceae bacterium]